MTTDRETKFQTWYSIESADNDELPTPYECFEEGIRYALAQPVAAVVSDRREELASLLDAAASWGVPSNIKLAPRVWAEIAAALRAAQPDEALVKSAIAWMLERTEMENGNQSADDLYALWLAAEAARGK